MDLSTLPLYRRGFNCHVIFTPIPNRHTYTMYTRIDNLLSSTQYRQVIAAMISYGTGVCNHEFNEDRVL